MAERRDPARRATLTPEVFHTQTYTQTAVGLLRALILDGQFGPGERLNELAIAEQLQISRSPIREALHALAGQGLVRFVPGRGAFVTEFDEGSVRELGELRVALETRAARLAAVRATREQLESLQRVLVSAARALQTGELEQILEKSDRSIQAGGGYPPVLDFHRGVIEAAHNSRLADVSEKITTQYRLARARAGRESAWASAAYEEHLEIYQAIARGDAAAAAAAMERHIVNSTEGIIEHLAGSVTSAS